MKQYLKKILTAAALLLVCSVLPAPAASAANVIIVLDPGHGSGETGATRTWNGRTYREEELNLKIAQYVKAELETYQGVEVYMTHQTLKGKPIDRQHRLQTAKNYNATALVSIHLNSTGDDETKKQTGAYAYVPSTSKYPNSNKYAKAARALGDAILKELNASVGLKNNGKAYDDELGIILYGMKYKIPSLIVEHCFVNNKSDCQKYLSTEAALKKIGQADAKGIAAYYKLVKKGEGSTTPTDGGEQQGSADDNRTGWLLKDGKKYNYYYKGTKLANGWKNIGGKYYYLDAEGVLQTGVIKIDGSLYLTDANGVRQTGFVKIGKNQYYADSNGKLYTGWKTYKKKKYYFSKTSGAAYTGSCKIGTKYYLFSKVSFGMITGWNKTLMGYKRYYLPSTGAMVRRSWKKIDGKWYYFTSSGKAFKNCRRKIGRKWYTFDKNSVCTNRK